MNQTMKGNCEYQYIMFVFKKKSYKKIKNKRNHTEMLWTELSPPSSHAAALIPVGLYLEGVMKTE